MNIELSWVVLIPPVAVLMVALATHNVLYALFAGIMSASLLVTKGQLFAACALAGNRLLEESSLTHLWNRTGNYDHAYTFGFLIALGILIELMTRSGGLTTYAQLLRRRIRTLKQAEMVPLIIGPFFFLDDYLNNLVGGSVVRPLFDQFHIARAKLAYILNALSSSQCLLVPASSWLALILMQLQAAGVTCDGAAHPLILADPSHLYIGTLLYLLYPILSIASAWFVVRASISYGPMREKEEAPVNIIHSAREKTEGQAIIQLDTPGEKTSAASPLSFIVPLSTFLLGIPAMMLYLGSWHPWGGQISWCDALQNSDTLFAALWWASCFSCIINTIFLYTWCVMPKRVLIAAYSAGFAFMRNSLLLLLFAWTLSSLLKHDVPTGVYLAHTIIAHASPVIIPLMCFWTGTLITASIGSSWGMISIMIPLTIPLITTVSTASLPTLVEALPLLLPTLGAVLSGAAAGPHFSPITDAAIISSTTAGMTPMAHIRTMIPYSVPPFLAASIGFIAYALLPRTLLACFAVVGGCIALMIAFHGMLAAWYEREET